MFGYSHVLIMYLACCSTQNCLSLSTLDNNKKPDLMTTTQTMTTTTTTTKWTRIPILEYHDDWVCVDKPCGLTVHRSRDTPKNEPVLTSKLKRQLARNVFPVHRLDHRTSGAMLLAFDSVAAGRLHDEAIRHGTKKYIALLRGKWSWENEDHVVVDKPLRVHNITKDARTKFTLLATTLYYDGNDRCSLVLCEPLTGRTHQIRRHAHAIGHPVIGDSQHGDSKINRWWKMEKGMDRLALHCWSLKFTITKKADHDDYHENFECIAPLPLKWQSILQTIPTMWDQAVSKEPRLAMEPYDKKGGSHGRYYRQKQGGSQ